MIRNLVPLALLLASGCSTVLQPPASNLSRSTMGDFSRPIGVTLDPVPDDWWRLYDDPALDRLITASLAANADLRVAYANLDSSRALLRQAKAARLPQTTIESGLTVDGTAAQPSANTVPSTDWDIALAASWDPDLFGRLREGALAARADVAASEAARDGVRVAVVADTVLAYVELCGANRAIAVGRDVVAAQDRSLEIVRDQLKAGEVSPLEVSQVAMLAASTRATIPPFEAQRDNALYRLATLQGRPPAEARQFTPTCSSVPRLRAGAPVGDGTALLLRRPDVREAERKLAAATARVGVARADLYPRLNLAGALGLLTGSFDAAVSPLVTWAFPNQAPARAKLAQAQAVETGALAGWDVAILRALRDVETAISAYDAEQRRAAALTGVAREAQAYARRASARVRLGDAPGLLEIDAKRALASASLQQAQAELAVAQAEVSLFRALGGGWRSASDAR